LDATIHSDPQGRKGGDIQNWKRKKFRAHAKTVEIFLYHVPSLQRPLTSPHAPLWAFSLNGHFNWKRSLREHIYNINVYIAMRIIIQNRPVQHKLFVFQPIPLPWVCVYILYIHIYIFILYPGDHLNISVYLRDRGQYIYRRLQRTHNNITRVEVSAV